MKRLWLLIALLACGPDPTTLAIEISHVGITLPSFDCRGRVDTQRWTAAFACQERGGAATWSVEGQVKDHYLNPDGVLIMHIWRRGCPQTGQPDIAVALVRDGTGYATIKTPWTGGAGLADLTVSWRPE